MGSLKFHLTCDWDLREPLELPLGIQVTFQVVRGSTGLLLSHCKGIGPHLALRGSLMVFLEFQQEVLGSSRVAMGTSGNLSYQESQASFQVSRGTSGFLSCGCRGIEPHLNLRRETQGFSLVATGISGFLSNFNS